MRRYFWCVASVLFALSMDGQTSRLQVATGVSVPYPSNWSAPPKQTTAAELVTPAGATKDAQARMYITVHTYATHDDAVKRVGDIAGEVPSVPLEVMNIGGWPAGQRTYTARLPQGSDAEPRSADAQRVTTAIAAGTSVVRLEAFLAPGASTAIADQVRAIGRGTTFATPPAAGALDLDLKQLRDAIASPRVTLPVTPPVPPLGVPDEPLDPPAVLVSTGNGNTNGAGGEIEVAASNNATNVLIAIPTGMAFSSNGGTSYQSTLPRGGVNNIPFIADGDLSVAVAKSGRFYVSFLDGARPTTRIGVGFSIDNGQTVNFLSTAMVCAPGCGPDQPHIAADRVTGGRTSDRVYVVYRHMGPLASAPSGSGSTVAAIACSANSGSTWNSIPQTVDASSDYPRVTVGGDGFVYVVYLSGPCINLHKYSSCASGLVPQTGFPVTVTAFIEPRCPIPGLDRCLGGNTLGGGTVAVDDTNPSHVYVAFATNNAPANEDVFVQDSSDGGRTWPRRLRVNAARGAKRFLPWVCSAGGSAFVTWYDRRAATTAQNDLTDAFAGNVYLRGSALERGPEVNLTVNSDPQCASGWPCGAEFQNQSTSCSVQPQFGGVCRNAGGGGSNNRCNFAAPGCPAGESCVLSGNGCPKYGDYKGLDCAGGRVFTAWASATTPAGAPAGTGMRIFASTLFLPRMTVRTTLSPANDPGRFNVLADGSAKATSVGNAGLAGPFFLGPGTHTIGAHADRNTNNFLYRFVVGGDCASSGAITLAYSDTKQCTITITRRSEDCSDACETRRDTCLEDAHDFGRPSAPCIQQFNDCVRRCH